MSFIWKIYMYRRFESQVFKIHLLFVSQTMLFLKQKLYGLFNENVTKGCVEALFI